MTLFDPRINVRQDDRTTDGPLASPREETDLRFFIKFPYPPPSPPRNETWKYLSRVTRVNRADTFVRINSSCLRERGRRGSAETGREGGRKGMVWSERVEVLKRNELLGYLMYIRDFGFR